MNDAGPHRHIAEYPSKCEGCEHLAADLVSRAPAWMLAGRAEHSDSEPDLRARRIVERAANMGLCSQTHHEHLMRDAQKVDAALSSPVPQDEEGRCDGCVDCRELGCNTHETNPIYPSSRSGRSNG